MAKCKIHLTVISIADYFRLRYYLKRIILIYIFAILYIFLGVFWIYKMQNAKGKMQNYLFVFLQIDTNIAMISFASFSMLSNS